MISTDPPPMRSRLPFLGHALSLMRDPVRFQREGHRRLGNVFSASLFGLPLVFAGGADTLSRVLWAKNDELSLVAAYRKMVGRLFGEDLFIEIPHETLRGLSAASLRRQSGPLAHFTTSILHHHLAGRSGATDTLKLCSDLVFDMSSWYVCGAELSASVREELGHLFTLLESDYSILGMYLPIETPSMKRRIRARQRILELLKSAIRERLRGPRQEADYMQSLIDGRVAAHPGANEDEQLQAAALSIMGILLGAHTNTAMGLAACLLDLLEHPRHLDAVRAEQARVLTGSELDLDALLGLPALYRSINESLRLRGTGGLWRLVMKPLALDGRILREGTLLGSSMGLVNFSPHTYPNPHEYDPDRYLRMKTDEFQCPSAGARELTFGAFGAGRHVCPGRSLAYVMLGTALTVMLRDHDIRLREKPWFWFDVLTGGVARPVGRFRVSYTPRPRSPTSTSAG